MRPSSWIPPVVWMAVIMVMSSGWFSSRHTGGVVVGLLAWVAPWLAPADVAALHGALAQGGARRRVRASSPCCGSAR